MWYKEKILQDGFRRLAVSLYTAKLFATTLKKLWCSQTPYNGNLPDIEYPSLYGSTGSISLRSSLNMNNLTLVKDK